MHPLLIDVGLELPREVTITLETEMKQARAPGPSCPGLLVIAGSSAVPWGGFCRLSWVH